MSSCVQGARGRLGLGQALSMLPGTGNCATWRCKVPFLLATQAPILAFVGDKTKLMPNLAHETDATRMARRKIQAQKMVTVSRQGAHPGRPDQAKPGRDEGEG